MHLFLEFSDSLVALLYLLPYQAELFGDGWLFRFHDKRIFQAAVREEGAVQDGGEAVYAGSVIV